jgi:hypothetical protein
VVTSATGAVNTAASTTASNADAALFQLLLGDAAGLGATPTPQSAATQLGAGVAPETGLGILSLQTEGGETPTGEVPAPAAPSSEAISASSSEASGATTQQIPKSASPQVTPNIAQASAQPIATQIVALQTVQQTVEGAKTGLQGEAAGDNTDSDAPAEDAGASTPVTQPAATPAAGASAAAALSMPTCQANDKAGGAKTSSIDGEEPVVDSAFGAKPGAKNASAKQGEGKQPANAATALSNANAPTGPRTAPLQPVLDTTTSVQATQTIGDSTISYSGAAEPPRLGADQTAAAAFSRSTPSPAAASLAHQIVRRFDGGTSNFQVRLDPPELGRVDVRLTVDKDKRVTAKIGADSVATLTELRGATREIERALADAGLDLAQDGLSFDLNEQPQSKDNAYDAPAGRAAKEPTLPDASAPPIARPFGLERWGASGVDVWA